MGEKSESIEEQLKSALERADELRVELRAMGKFIAIVKDERNSARARAAILGLRVGDLDLAARAALRILRDVEFAKPISPEGPGSNWREHWACLGCGRLAYEDHAPDCAYKAAMNGLEKALCGESSKTVDDGSVGRPMTIGEVLATPQGVEAALGEMQRLAQRVEELESDLHCAQQLKPPNDAEVELNARLKESEGKLALAQEVIRQHCFAVDTLKGNDVVVCQECDSTNNYHGPDCLVGKVMAEANEGEQNG